MSALISHGHAGIPRSSSSSLGCDSFYRRPRCFPSVIAHGEKIPHVVVVGARHAPVTHRGEQISARGEKRRRESPREGECRRERVSERAQVSESLSESGETSECPRDECRREVSERESPREGSVRESLADGGNVSVRETCVGEKDEMSRRFAQWMFSPGVLRDRDGESTREQI